ncbi:MAG: DUF2085 domain-containing protein [Anaerolineae bacterium]|nr:DUF2085 domain-containing protein [Anaerolineae bacterium]
MPQPTPTTQPPDNTDPFPPTRPAAPRPYSRATVWLVVALTALVLALWWLGTPGGLSAKPDAIGYAICHQIAERSFHVDGHPLPLCARCTGIYLGVMIGFGVLLVGGRGKAALFPPRRVIVVMALFVIVLGLDGVNSYLHLFPGYRGPYAPSNWLRLVTGSLAGLTMITILLPAFSGSAWAAPEYRPVLGGLGELAGLVIVIGLVDALVLLRTPLILTAAGILSALGPVVVLVLVWSILFLAVTRHENTIRTLAELRLPLVAGLGLTLLMLGAITILRFRLTGTWEGFSAGMFG